MFFIACAVSQHMLLCMLGMHHFTQCLIALIWQHIGYRRRRHGRKAEPGAGMGACQGCGSGGGAWRAASGHYRRAVGGALALAAAVLSCTLPLDCTRSATLQCNIAGVQSSLLCVEAMIMSDCACT